MVTYTSPEFDGPAGITAARRQLRADIAAGKGITGRFRLAPRLVELQGRTATGWVSITDDSAEFATYATWRATFDAFRLAATC